MALMTTDLAIRHNSEGWSDTAEIISKPDVKKRTVAQMVISLCIVQGTFFFFFWLQQDTGVYSSYCLTYRYLLSGGSIKRSRNTK